VAGAAEPAAEDGESAHDAAITAAGTFDAAAAAASNGAVADADEVGPGTLLSTQWVPATGVPTFHYSPKVWAVRSSF